MKAFFALLLVAIIICAWSPWFEMEDARQLIYNKVYESQSTLQEGCTLSITDNTLMKVPFGYRETVHYDCTFNTDFITEGDNNVFVTFFKQVINVPHPIIR